MSKTKTPPTRVSMSTPELEVLRDQLRYAMPEFWHGNSFEEFRSDIKVAERILQRERELTKIEQSGGHASDAATIEWINALVHDTVAEYVEQGVSGTDPGTLAAWETLAPKFGIDWGNALWRSIEHAVERNGAHMRQHAEELRRGANRLTWLAAAVAKGEQRAMADCRTVGADVRATRAADHTASIVGALRPLLDGLEQIDPDSETAP